MKTIFEIDVSVHIESNIEEEFMKFADHIKKREHVKSLIFKINYNPELVIDYDEFKHELKINGFFIEINEDNIDSICESLNKLGRKIDKSDNF